MTEFDEVAGALGAGKRDGAPSRGIEDGVADVSSEPESDETTGASPGTAQACDDLGLNSLSANLERFNIKPPGQ